MRFRESVASIGATLIGTSDLMNWVLKTSLGKSELDRQILRATSLTLSVVIALLPTLLLCACRERLIYFMLGLPLVPAFVAFSLFSAVGFPAKACGGFDKDRALVTARLSAG
jgi:hypothetical protein